MKQAESVWVVDDDKSIRWVLEKALRRESMEVESFENSNDLLNALEERRPKVVISDIRMPGMDGLSLLKK